MTRATTRVKRPCTHKVANHQHGTRACYVLDRCRCEPCTKAAVDEARELRLQQLYGRYDKYADAEPVREHLRSLMEYGIGLKRIGRLAGISGGSMNKLMYTSATRADRGTSARILRTTAERLLAIKPTPANLAPAAHDHERTATARTHLRALVALGWSQSKLAARLGMLPTNFGPVIGTGLIDDRVITRETVDKIEALYAELSMQLPPQDDHRNKIAAARARNNARRRGWLPPLALDEDEIAALEIHDGQFEHGPDVDEVVVARRINGDRTVRLNRGERLEVIAQMNAAGHSDPEIERRTGINVRQVLRDRQFLGLPAVDHPNTNTSRRQDGAA